jgi:thiol-disulfide isomerase/thioredoxin
MRSLVVAVFLVAAGLGQVAHADALKVGDRLAELDVAVDAGGKSFKLKSLKGGWLLVTVGADWCKPCAKELPAWDKLAPEFKDKVKFVAINIADNIDDGKKFNKKLKLSHLTLIYMPADKSAVVAKYGSDNMPTTFIADPQGVIRYVRAGFEKGDVSGETKKMREQLTKLTAAK